MLVEMRSRWEAMQMLIDGAQLNRNGAAAMVVQMRLVLFPVLHIISIRGCDECEEYPRKLISHL